MQLIDFCKEKRSLQEAMEHMGWRDKTKFRKRFIIPLLEKGLMRQTIPEKPTSPNQRYQATARGIKLLEENRR